MRIPNGSRARYEPRRTCAVIGWFCEGRPVKAHGGLTEGPVFRSIDRWGNVGDGGLHAGSFVPLLRALFREAGLTAPDSCYSSHSLRRGFATWANSNGWDLKMLMGPE